MNGEKRNKIKSNWYSYVCVVHCEDGFVGSSTIWPFRQFSIYGTKAFVEFVVHRMNFGFWIASSTANHRKCTCSTRNRKRRTFLIEWNKISISFVFLSLQFIVFTAIDCDIISPISSFSSSYRLALPCCRVSFIAFDKIMWFRSQWIGEILGSDRLLKVTFFTWWI